MRLAVGRACVAAAALSSVTAAARADFRDVQVLQVDFGTGVVTLFNFGDADEPLDGFRLCTADENQQLQYTAAPGFNGRTIETGTTFSIHWLNDAPAGDPDSINVSSLGGLVAVPLDRGPWGFALYRATALFNPADMADYVQWTDDLGNPGNLTADARAPTAVAAGLWTAVDDWVVTFPDSPFVQLLDTTGGLLHGPDDYTVTGSGVCFGDLTDDGVVDVDDLLLMLGAWGGNGPSDISGPNGRPDGIVNVNDLLALLGAWGPCDP